MIPLGISQEGSFFVGRCTDGRGQWLCINSKCIHRILKEPHKIRRKRDCPAPSREMVQEQLFAHFSNEAKRHLVEASKSGLIVHGSHRVKKEVKQNLCVILFSTDSGTATRTQIEELYKQVQSWTFPLSSREIGRLIGRGPRSVLALQPSRRTQSLIDSLRGWVSLG